RLRAALPRRAARLWARHRLRVDGPDAAAGSAGAGRAAVRRRAPARERRLRLRKLARGARQLSVDLGRRAPRRGQRQRLWTRARAASAVRRDERARLRLLGNDRIAPAEPASAELLPGV